MTKVIDISFGIHPRSCAGMPLPAADMCFMDQCLRCSLLRTSWPETVFPVWDANGCISFQQKGPELCEEAELRAKRERDLKLAQELADKIADWRRHGETQTWQIRQAAPALRYSRHAGNHSPVGGAFIETSWGASIPAEEAIKLWPLIQLAKRGRSWRIVPGRSIDVGGYPLTKLRGDGSIVVGCHDIAYSEVEYIATQLGLTA